MKTLIDLLKESGMPEASAIVEKFVAENANCIDAQPVVLIEHLTGDE